jgi:hypothetical protein
MQSVYRTTVHRTARRRHIRLALLIVFVHCVLGLVKAVRAYALLNEVFCDARFDKTLQIPC